MKKATKARERGAKRTRRAVAKPRAAWGLRTRSGTLLNEWFATKNKAMANAWMWPQGKEPEPVRVRVLTTITPILRTAAGGKRR